MLNMIFILILHIWIEDMWYKRNIRFSHLNTEKKTANLTKIFLIYASVNHIRILQRQFDDGAQNLTRRIFPIKNRYFISPE